MRRKRKGFTLVEMLTTMMISSILMAMIVPTYHQARRKAVWAACINNLTQIAKGTEMFRTDTGDDLPPTLESYNNFNWVREYVITHDVFRCPGSSYPLLKQTDPVSDIKSFVYIGHEDDFASYAGDGPIAQTEPEADPPAEPEEGGGGGTYIPEDMTYVYVVDDPNTLKFEDAETGLGEDETSGQSDQFLITVSGHEGSVGITTKASTSSETSTLENPGDTVTDSLGFKLTLVGISETGEYTFSVEAIPDEADGQFHALSHVEFGFSENATVTHINGQEIEGEEGEIAVQRLQLVIGEEEPEDPPADPPAEDPVDPQVAAYWAVAPYKETMCIYDSSSDHHEGRVNVVSLEDGHAETKYGDYNFWEFDDEGNLVLPTIE